MKCPKCGYDNSNQDLFCTNCGTKLERRVQPKKKSKLIIIIVCIALLIGGGIGGYFYMNKVNTTKKYNTLITEAEDYLENLDYDKAIDKYLEAIKIEPKKADPYLKIADIYITQEEYQSALDILEQAKENIGDNNKEINNKYDEVEHLLNINVEGMIVDSDGNNLDGATIEVKSNKNNQVTTTVTSNDGKFSFKVEKGSYTITVTLDEYETTEQTIEIDGDLDDLEITLASPISKVLQAYADYLSSAGKDNFCLIYLDDDNIPELVIQQGDYHAAGVIVYQYQKGNIVQLTNEIGSWGLISYMEKDSLFNDSYNGVGYDSHYVMDKNGNTICSISYNWESTLPSIGGNLDGKVNNISYNDYDEFLKAVDATEYYKVTNKQISLEDQYESNSKVTKENAINSSNIQALRNGDYEQFLC